MAHKTHGIGKLAMNGGAGECREFLGIAAQKYGLWIGAAPQAGRTIHEDFSGGGYLFVPTSERVYAPPDWSPGQFIWRWI